MVRWHSGLALAVALGALACSTEADPRESDVLELVNWWATGGERDALQELLAVHQAEYPETRVVNSVVATSTDARAQIDRRMVGLEPPDAYQANVGLDLLDWVRVNGIDDSETKLRALDAAEITGHGAWTEVFPEALVERLGIGGRVYGVPVNIHRINVLFYNQHVFAEYGLEPPTELEDLYAVIDRVLADNATRPESERIIPLAVGSNAGSTWAMSLLLFENLLPAVTGREFYLDYFQGRRAPDDPRLIDALDEMRRLWLKIREGDPDTNQRGWSDAVELVARGEAAMTVMGDWAKGSLQAADLVPDRDFGAIPFPGTGNTFIFTADTFATPKGALHRDAATAWLRTVASPAGQNAFNPTKGSIPARIADVDTDVYDAMAQRTIASFERDALAPALSALAPPDWSTAVNEALAEFLDAPDPNPDTLRFVLTNYHDLLGAP